MSLMIRCRWLTSALAVVTHCRALTCLLVLPVLSHAAIGEKAGAGELEEIIVTARKIEEDVLRVPISIQVIDRESMEVTDPSSLYTLQFDVPGLVVANHGFFGARISLRGVVDQGVGTLSVAAHMNGVYLGQSDLALARLFDMERVEVLKGPQGTLYGRNATGGSFNFLARLPEDGTNAAFEAAAGSFDTLRAEGHVNFGNEKLALRIAGTASDGDGYIRNTVDDRRFAEEDYYGFRASGRVQATDDLGVTLFAQRVVDDGGANDVWLPNKIYLPDPDDIHLTTVTDPNPYLDMRNDLAGAEVNWKLGKAELTSVTGYAESHTESRDDCAGLPAFSLCVRTLLPGHYEQWSQEFRVSSSGDDGDWLAGLFLFDGQGLIHYTLRVPGDAPRPINDYVSESDSESWALFGQATRRIGDHWRVMAGLRYSDDSEGISHAGTGFADDPVPVLTDDAWDNVSWRLNASWEPNDRWMFYGGVATGYKSGGFTGQRLDDGSLDDYGPENLLAWEFGGKWRSADSRNSLTASAFYYDFEDLQVQTVALVDGIPNPVVDNAARARIAGIDFAAETLLGEYWNLGVGVVWLPERDYVEYRTEAGEISLDGNKLVRAPEWSGSVSATYRVPLGGHGDFLARVDYSYRSHVFHTNENLETFSQDAFGLLDAYLRYVPHSGRWYVFVSGRNLRDEPYFDQVFIQSAPGRPRWFEIGFGLTF